MLPSLTNLPSLLRRILSSVYRTHPLKMSSELPERDAKRRKINSDVKPAKRDKKQKDKSNKNAGWGRRGLDVPMPRPEGEAAEPRLPKKQVALLLGFCGSAYHGMQFQKPNPPHPEYPSIEGTLFAALIRARAISKDNSDDPYKVALARAARTDRGVHAAGNLVSLKMITSVPGQDDMLTRINEELPPDIRVWDIIRVKNSFNARTACDSRRYTYLLPSYALIPPKPGCGFVRAMERFLGKPSEATVDPFWAAVDSEDTSSEKETKRKREWRVTPEIMARMRSMTPKFEGTHNFHNFTVTNNPNDASNKRLMKNIQVLDPQVHGDTEWIPFSFHGQSFMLHQRKMMFTMLMACRTKTPPHIISELYSIRRVQITKAPALGLLLEYPVYDAYNAHTDVNINQKVGLDSPDYRPPIDFSLLSSKLEAFKQQHIYTNMRSIESRTGLFDSWIKLIDKYEGDDFLYFNPEGIIPEEAVHEHGKRRVRPFKEQKVFDRTSFAIEEEDPEQRKELMEVEASLAGETRDEVSL